MMEDVILVLQTLKTEVLCLMVGCSSPGLRCVHLLVGLLMSQDQAATEGGAPQSQVTHSDGEEGTGMWNERLLGAWPVP